MAGAVNPRRHASHAGTWYSMDESVLNGQLRGWLERAGGMVQGELPTRALIAPHAGYSYSGHTAAHAYRTIDPSKVKRVFILGPSHHYRLKGCALSRTTTHQTPLYDILVDRLVTDELHATGNFEWMSQDTDENEHSIEMHLPYIAKIMEGQHFTIIPVLVGNLNRDAEKFYGQLFAKYLADTNNLFVISSDFCHWGDRFNYTYHEQRNGSIAQHIEKLDKWGMEHIEALDSEAFHGYLKRFNNTICGRHPIGVLLCAVEAMKMNSCLANGHHADFKLKFFHYAQSNHCLSRNDTSVSYAAGVLSLSI